MSIKPNILYVDDEPENCELMKVWLRIACGFEVTTAHDGESAMQLIDNQFFDAYLLDYALPDTTGVEICRDIRARAISSPVVMYTALDRQIDRDRAAAAGANAYVVKPDQLGSLINILADLMSNNVGDPPKARVASAPASEPGDPGHRTLRFRRRSSGIV